MHAPNLTTPAPPAPPTTGGIDRALRPQRFDDYLGQPALVDRLKIAVAAARRRGEPLEHVLLSGPPGTGKTTLAGILANEMGGTLHTVMAPALQSATDVVGIVTKLQRGDVLFIDEIHRLSSQAEENLYSAMEDFRVSILLEPPRKPGARLSIVPKTSVEVPLSPFTLIGATTREGMLTQPLRARFGLVEVLELYTPEALLPILQANAARLGLAAEPDALRLLAERSRGTPRIANRLLRRVRDHAQAAGTDALTPADVRDTLKLHRIDHLGLTAQDRAYLRTILEQYDGGPVGVEALAATLQTAPDTLADVIEPYLLRAGLVRRTRAGRLATDKARAHLAR